MTTPQRPIGSGFGYRSTAAEVVEGIDLSGRLAIVTGGYSGLGLETVRALSAAGATVLVPARRPSHAKEMLVGVPRVEVDEVDLGSQDSVRAFAERVLDAGDKRRHPHQQRGDHGLPGDAGGTGLGGAVRHEPPRPLRARQPAVAVCSPTVARAWSRSPRPGTSGRASTGTTCSSSAATTSGTRYGQAKTANALFAVQLDALGQDAGVRAFAVHPGGIFTPLQRHLAQEEMVAAGWLDADGNPDDRFKTPEQGAATSTWAATSPQLSGMGGVYCENCDIAKPTDPDSPTARDRGRRSARGRPR